jgi:hypothetical protein
MTTEEIDSLVGRTLREKQAAGFQLAVSKVRLWQHLDDAKACHEALRAVLDSDGKDATDALQAIGKVAGQEELSRAVRDVVEQRALFEVLTARVVSLGF